MISQYNNFFEHQDFEYLHNRAIQIITDKFSMFRVNLTAWDNRLTNTTKSPVLFQDISKETKEYSIIQKRIQQFGIEGELDPYFFFALPESEINWHRDDNLGAITAYINKEWDMNDGGYLAYKENENIKCIPPLPNTAVFQDATTEHKTTRTLSTSPVRMSIQVFINDR